MPICGLIVPRGFLCVTHDLGATPLGRSCGFRRNVRAGYQFTGIKYVEKVGAEWCKEHKIRERRLHAIGERKANLIKEFKGTKLLAHLEHGFANRY